MRVTFTGDAGNEESVTSDDGGGIRLGLQWVRSGNDWTATTLTLPTTHSTPVTLPHTVTVDYAKPNGPDFIRDTQGRVASSFSGRAVSNDTPAIALTDTIWTARRSPTTDRTTSHFELLREEPLPAGYRCGTMPSR